VKYLASPYQSNFGDARAILFMEVILVPGQLRTLQRPGNGLTA
jgi:uncharacterized protein YdiU (UPF0061 family)